MDLEASIAFIRKEIDKHLAGRMEVPEGFLDNFVQFESGISSLLDEDLRIQVVRHLESYYWTKQEDGHSLSLDMPSWYPELKLRDDFHPHFWPRLKEYWEEYSVIPRDAIRSTDKVTDEIMDYLGNPGSSELWPRSGLVMGHVQSGKTTNYSALITKAADAGYRIIVVLAGLTNALRKQTQERLDETFVGKSSLGDEFNIEIYPVSQVFSGRPGYQPRYPYCGTTQSKDFNVDTTRSVGASEGNFADPILFVTKKHPSVLERLANWLKSLQEGRKLDGPMLVIDDEADNASVNTSKYQNEITRINQRIRELLQCSRRSTYVGYTATPFANIFIHPDSRHSMVGDDLFPKHFIKSLEPPSNYIGARDLFAEDGRLADPCVVDLPDDWQEILPLRHKSDHAVFELPVSLKNAVITYVLFRAIRILSRAKDSHSSMLVNVSRFNKVQASVQNLIEDFLSELRSEIDAWSKSAEWRTSDLLSHMEVVWNREYDDISEFDWSAIRESLGAAIRPIETLTVNMKGAALDYKSRRGSPLHVIAVGGLALARGLTLEGLAVSYVLRNVGAGDTLLQLGRWFGYRPGYEDKCRIYLTEEMREHFKHTSLSVEELRQDLIRMERLGRKPYEFGLKVRQSPTGIAITAANKMRTAEPIKLAGDFSSKHVQAHEIFDDKTVNNENISRISSFLDELSSDSSVASSTVSGTRVWTNVPGRLVLRLLEALELPQVEFSKMGDGTSLVGDYMRDRVGSAGELDFWTVALPGTESASGKHGPRIPMPEQFSGGEKIFCRQRYTAEHATDRQNIIKITGSKNVVADLPKNDLVYGEETSSLLQMAERVREENSDSKWSMERCILESRRSPLFLIHCFDVGIKKRSGQTKLGENIPGVSVSVGFIPTSIEPQEHTYAASVRLIEQLKAAADREEEDDDEVPDDD